MADNQTYDRVADILIDVLMIDDPSIVHAGAHIVRDLGAESINFAEISVAIADEFASTVNGADVAKAATVGSLVAYVDEQRAKAEA